MKINCKSLNTCISDIDTKLSTLRENQINLFQQLKNACDSWSDGNSVEFRNKIADEKKTTHDLYNLFSIERGLLNLIHSYYSSFGNVIKCNTDKKESSMKLMEECAQNFESVISCMNSVTFDISTVTSNILSAKTLFLSSKNNVDAKYSSVIDKESKILAKAKIDREFSIEGFEFEFKIRTFTGPNTLNMSTIYNDINLVEFYSNEESNSLNSLTSAFDTAITHYVSDNTTYITKKISDLKSYSNTMKSNRSVYLNILNTTVNNYTTSVDYTLGIFKGDDE